MVKDCHLCNKHSPALPVLPIKQPDLPSQPREKIRNRHLWLQQKKYLMIVYYYRNYVINKLTCEIVENKPLGSWMYFLWILRVVCFPVKHSCLYNKMKQIGLKIHGCPILLIIYRITDWFGISNSELSVTSVASSHKCPSYCLHLNWPLRGSSLECINFCLYNYSRFWISVYKSRRVHRWWCVWWQY